MGSILIKIYISGEGFFPASGNGKCVGPDRQKYNGNVEDKIKETRAGETPQGTSPCR
jgi:hypothetical protein